MSQSINKAEVLTDIGEASCRTVLVVEDDSSLREIIGKSLSLANYDVLLADSGEQALQILRDTDNITLMISDVQMKPMDGNVLLKRCKSLYPNLPVILMTAYGTIENAVNAMHDGAADYLVKPFEHEELIMMVDRFAHEASDHQEDGMTDGESSDGLIAIDQKSIQLAQVARRVAASEVTVMISGESGVGKEVLSKYIHENSPRNNGPFIAINCAAIPENMLESVLFGYEKGAYTGAYQSKAGKFEQAHGGTLLLDEITEMDLGLQAKLLRVLQEREVERLGGTKVIPLDVRIIATTNRDLQQSVSEGTFREDLFYRLNVFPLTISPLRERSDDILPIANKMLNKDTQSFAKNYLSISAQRALRNHDWPGNIRELENVIQRALILMTGTLVDEQDIQFENTACNIQNVASMPGRVSGGAECNRETGLNSDLKAREQDLIISALNTRNSRKEVAEKLGISPRTLRYKLARMRDAGIPLPV